MAIKSSIWLVAGIMVMVLAIGLVGIALAQNIEAEQPLQNSSTDKIEAELITKFSAGAADFIVHFEQQADLSPAYQMTWEARGEYVYNILKQTAARSQEAAKIILDSHSIRYQTFITGNELYIWAGSLDAAQSLSTLPEVAYIRSTRTYQVLPITAESDLAERFGWFGDQLTYQPQAAVHELAPAGEVAWGIVDTGAVDFWNSIGVQGDGILVANIDTGVDYTHDALDQNYKCADNPSDPACWLDPGTADCSGPDGGPCDSWNPVYHGTHVMGTQAGDDDPSLEYQVGMAPNSEWIACLGCPYGGCPDFDLNTCADWLLAPGGDPANRPHVVNNSWGGWGGSDFYLAQVNAWRAAGIFPAFAAGNAGPSCGTLGSPGDYQESFGSAAHDSGRVIADFSSRGPSYYGDDPYTKPNISSPGVDVLSAMPGDGWQYMSGTSMASPHTAGAVALLWSCNPGLIGQIDQTFQILQANVDAPPEGNCGAPGDGEGNYTYGYGYLNVYTSGLQWCGETGTLAGVVTDLESNPIPIAHIYSTPGPYATNTDEDGNYQMTMMVGNYDVTAEAFGYFPHTEPVTIITDTTTTLDFMLEPAPMVLVSGNVTDAMTGWPLYASIEIAGYPYGTIWNDPVTGSYSVALPQGSDYEFTINGWMPGYLPETRTVGPFYSDANEDFQLTVDAGPCNAPGYQIESFFTEDFEVDDGDYAVYGYGEGGNSWEWGPPSPYIGPGGAHSGVRVWATDLGGNYYDYEDSYIESPPIDLSSLSGQGINFSWWQWLVSEYYFDFVDIQVSNDGGFSWSTVYGPVSGWLDEQWSQHSFKLDPGFAVSNFRVRFHLLTDSSVTYPGWYIDDLVIGTCQPQEGGLVVGNVYDANFDTALTGAVVTSDSGEETYTKETVDPLVSDAFYTIFSPSNAHYFTATMTDYLPAAERVSVNEGSTVEQDFYLSAGHLLVDPTSLQTTLEMGYDQTLSLMLSNDGTNVASFEFLEVGESFVPASLGTDGKTEPISLLGRSIQPKGVHSNTPPADYAPLLIPSEILSSWPLAGTVAIFKDADPWGVTDVEMFLSANGIPYEVHTSTDFGTLDFDQYGMIVFSGDQPQSFYDAYASYVEKFEEYVEGGGFLNFFSCDIGWNGGSLTAPLPGGMTWTGWILENYNVIEDTAHPVVQGVPSPFFGDFASHGHFNNLPENAHIIAREQMGGMPTIVEYPIGAGWIIAFAQPLEISHNWGWDAGLIMENTLMWGYTFEPIMDVPWLSESPISGTLDVGASQGIDVTFDAAMVPQPGDYKVQLSVKNDTPYGALKVPVTMTVLAPADWGKLLGQVSSTGYCDQELNPLKEATLLIQSSTGISWTVETSADGIYSWWLDQDGSPYTVTASYPEHQDGFASEVMISGGSTIQLDFELRWLVPCVQTTPTELETNLVLGESATLPITLTNAGGGSTYFELLEVDRGWIPTQMFSVIVPGYQPGTPTANSYAGQNKTAIGSFEYILPSDIRLMGSEARVLLVAAADVYQIQTMLQAYPDIEVVDRYDARYSTPALEELLAYDSVIMISNEWFNDAVAMGNVLADYVDAGGTVVQTVPTFYGSGWGLAGRFVDEGYNALIGIGDWFSWADLGDYDASHPIMEGVAYAGDYFRQRMELDADAEWVADWSDDEFIATKGNVVALNTAIFDGYSWSGDIPLIVHNSIAWLMGGGDVLWLSAEPISGTLAADTGLADINVSFDSAMVSQPGDYLATMRVKTDDPVNAKQNIAITMKVHAPEDWGKLTGMVESLGYCDVNPVMLMDYTVVVDVDGTPLPASLSDLGTYSVWLPEGTYSVSASADEHIPGSDVTVITAGEETTLDFALRWMAPCISGTPTEYSVEVPQGYKFVFPFQIINTGAGESQFKLKDRTEQEILVSSGEIASAQIIVSEQQQGAFTTQGLDLPPAPQATILDTGNVLQSWSPYENDFAWGIAYDGSNESVWVGDGWTFENMIYEYEPEGTPTGRGWSYEYGPTNGPADAAFNWNTGMIWVAAVGDGDCLHEIDPDNGETGNVICPPIEMYAFRGITYDPATDTYFGGGWNDQSITHFAANGTIIDSAYVGLNIAGLAYNPATLHMFVMVNDYDESVYVLDVANNYQIIGQFYIDGWPHEWNGAGLEFDCDGNLWAVAQATQTVYQFESGEEANLCETGLDATWLNENPQEGTVLADSTYDIELSFTAFPDMDVGSSYTATLILRSDDPISDTYRVPITMNVIAPLIELNLSPAEIRQSSPPGTVVNYQLTIQNVGNVPDMYELTLQDQDWSYMMDVNMVSLEPGEEAEITIFVFIPSSAEDGEQDVAMLKATSLMDPMVSAVTQLTTVALYQRLPRLTPSEASQIGEIGGMVTYDLTLWNFSVVADTIDLTVNSDWIVELPFTSYTLDSYEHVDFTVIVYIPGDVVKGDADEAVIIATSQSDPLASDTTRLLTYAGIGRKYLPLIER